MEANGNDRVYGFILDNTTITKSPIDMFTITLGFTGIICMMLLFIVGELVMERYEFGVLKNVISYGHIRYKVYISNLLCIFTAIILLSIMTIGVSGGIWKIIYGTGGGITNSEIIMIAKIIVIWLTILCAMGSVYTMLYTLVRNKSIVCSLGLLFTTFISMSVIELKVSYFLIKCQY